MTTKEELDAIKLEREKLELESLRDQVAQIRHKKEAQLKASEQQERDINEARRHERLRQSVCQHRKGGRDLEGIVNGNDPNFSVVKHSLPWGEVMVMCTRCQKTWRPGDKEYAQALSFPTDNQNSGASLFMNTYKAA